MKIRMEPCGHRSPDITHLFRITRWLWHVQHKRTCRVDRALRASE